MDLFSPFLEDDGLDDYINSLDEIVSSDKKNKPIVDEIKKEIVDEKPEPPKPVAVEERVVVEKKVNEEKEKVSRVIRPKDLFSYLRRKEVKKIVSLLKDHINADVSRNCGGHMGFSIRGKTGAEAFDLYNGFFPYYLRCGGHTVSMFIIVQMLRDYYVSYAM